MSHQERMAHPCVGRERVDFVLPGLAILEAICRVWPVGRLRVADRGLREGILLGLMERDRHRHAVGAAGARL
jgi:exopolyphosphatase/guanosine-5'-triphosphate,3'-diphosphate pyrophosphatase